MKDLFGITTSSLLAVVFIFQNSISIAQELLTLDASIANTIENNYGIQVARKNIEVASNNASKTAVGYNPTVNANAGMNYDIGGSTQQFGNGNENVVNNAASYGGNASVSANYLLFDQTRKVSLDQLRESLNLSNLQLRQTMELNVLQVVSLYYEVAKLAANLGVLEETIGVSIRRLERVRYQYEYGQGLALDVLNAEVDVQRDSINYFTTIQQLANSKRNLNVLMGMPVDFDYRIDTTVDYGSFTLEALEEVTSLQNVDVMLAQKNYDVTTYDLALIDAERKPTVSATGAYNFNFSDNPPGAFIVFSNSRGLALGLNASWNIYDGGLRKLREQNTQIALQTQSIQLEQIEQEVLRDLTNAWESFQNALFILRSEAISLSTSERNFNRTEEQFNLGQVTSVEFRQAQLNLLTASTNYNNAKFDAKIIELQLKQIAGMILQDLQ